VETLICGKKPFSVLGKYLRNLLLLVLLGIAHPIVFEWAVFFFLPFLEKSFVSGNLSEMQYNLHSLLQKILPLSNTC
jgi:hypothetical protein